MRRISQTLAFIQECLFPGGCALCGQTLLDGEEAWYGLCRRCQALFPVDREPRCSSCGRPLISEQGLCLPCREREPFHFDGGFVLYPYTGKYRELLKAYKFGNFRTLGNFFARRMGEILSRFPPEEASSFQWVPVPPRPGKIRKTGWDQADYLAKRLEPQYTRTPARSPQRVSPVSTPCLPVCRCLKRLSSKTQKALNREDRKRNMKGRIICVKAVPRRALLFDDVITTGSTLDACAEALREGGAEKVYAVSLFYD
ncbi:MAG: ComF family protein [Treponema sp.]|nr:ComF family protein [Treponema sp.]